MHLNSLHLIWVRRSGLWLYSVLLMATVANAQNRSWSISLVSGEEMQNVALQAIGHDTLYISRSANFSDWIVLDSIAQLRHETQGAILPATLIGGVVGGVIGFSVQPSSKNQSEANVYGTVFGVIVGGAAGFLVGSFLQSDAVYDLTKLGRPERIRIVIGLVSQ